MIAQIAVGAGVVLAGYIAWQRKRLGWAIAEATRMRAEVEAARLRATAARELLDREKRAHDVTRQELTLALDRLAQSTVPGSGLSRLKGL
jgi:hypothetical protein